MRKVRTAEYPQACRRLRRVSPARYGCRLAALSFFCAASLMAQTGVDLAERIQALEQQVTELHRRLGMDSTPRESGGASGSDLALPARVAALERQVEQLFGQIPSAPEPVIQNGHSFPTVRPAALVRVSAPALGSAEPAAAAQSAQASLPSLRRPATASIRSETMRLPVSGYMEMNFSKPQEQSAVLDFRRFVLLFGHSFSERLKFWSELEVEHAFVEGGEEKGELELEQAYVDFLAHPALSFRGGMLLTPMGIINERHEPPSFYGVLRPQVDTVIIPSTWFDTGAGIFGDLGRGFSYKFYAMSPLNAAGFTAEDGLRGGRQKGSQSFLQDWAQALRVEYRGLPRLVLGTSFWNGKTGFELRNVNPAVRMVEFDGRYRWNRLEFRGEFASAFLTRARELNLALERQTGINPNLARQTRGFYLEAATHLLPRASKYDLVGFSRYENFDTQYRMPRGYLPLKQFDRSLWTLGGSFYPHPDIALKADYQILRNQSVAVGAPNQFNLGLGWWF